MPACPSCSASLSPRLTESYVISCNSCGNSLVIRGIKPVSAPMPSDWSFLQLKTKGVYKDSPFEIIGRVRLQLRNDYKNFWCAEYTHGKILWIVESFNSFCVMDTTWQDFQGEDKHLRAGKKIKVNDGVLVGEYLEKCEFLSIEGEIGRWMNFEPKFFFVQASDANKTAFFTLRARAESYYMTGDKIPKESLQLQNILSWHEWK